MMSSSMLPVDVDGGEVVSAAELAARMEEAEIKAAAMFDEVCTYSSGVMDQNLWVCLTCAPESSGRAAVLCFGCAHACHFGPDHDVHPIYAKRGYRCDCGTPALGGAPCSNTGTGASETRAPNTTHPSPPSHNLYHRYCLCDSMYDESDPLAEDMVQCFFCQDWFHPSCLMAQYPQGASAPNPLDAHNIACPGCTARNLPLFLYSVVEGLVPIPARTAKRKHAADDAQPLGKQHKALDGAGASSEAEPAAAASSSSCLLAGATRWTAKPGVYLPLDDGWRARLCKCEACLRLYSEAGVGYVLDDGYDPDIQDDGASEEEDLDFADPSVMMSAIEVGNRVKAAEAEVAANPALAVVAAEVSAMKDRLRDLLRGYVGAGAGGGGGGGAGPREVTGELMREMIRQAQQQP